MRHLPTSDAIEPKTKKGHARLAWFVIVLAVIWVIYQQNYNKEKKENSRPQVNSSVLEFQGRIIFSLCSVSPEASKKLPVTGGITYRLCMITLLGDVDSSARAIEELQHMQSLLKEYPNTPISDRQKEVMGVLDSLYQSELAERPMTDKTKNILRAELGWFSKLCIYPRGSESEERKALEAEAQNRLLLLGLGCGLLFFLGVAGVVAWIVFAIKASEQKQSLGVTIQNRGDHGVYAETFAVMLLSFIFSGKLVSQDPSPLLKVICPFFSLLALLWPLLRGISWKDVKEDMGLHLGKQPWKEIVMGPLIYIKMLPALALSVVVLAVMMKLFREAPSSSNPFAPVDQAAHPIIAAFKGADKKTLLVLFFQMSVMAPVIEEIMFRGVLYQHLREYSARFGTVMSVILSAFISSFIFAALHPQGLMLVPFLMLIAFLFVFAREWRGSLLPGMMAHGIHNGVIFLFCTVILSI